MIVNIVSIQRTKIEGYKDAILVTVNPTVSSPFGFGSVADVSKKMYLVYPDTERNYRFLKKAKDNSNEFFEFSEMSFSEEYIPSIGNAYVHIQFFSNDDVASEAGSQVDLGLSVLWADRNIGAKAIGDFGTLFDYDDVSEKGKSSSFDSTNETKMKTNKDLASASWGNGWRMPSKAEFRELIDKCNWKQVRTNSGNVGFLITGPNGNQIFLPSAGVRMDNEILRRNDWGTYWTGDGGELSFDRNYREVSEWPSTFNGQSVRPVKDKEKQHHKLKGSDSVDRECILSTINFYDDVRAQLLSAYFQGNKLAFQLIKMVHEFTCPLFYAWEYFGYGKMADLWKEDLAIETYNRFKSRNVLEESRKNLNAITNGIFPFRTFDNDGKICEATKKILMALISALDRKYQQ